MNVDKSRDRNGWRHRNRAGMTLVELMIAVSIVVVLAMLAMAAFSKARRAVQTTRTLSALRVMASSFVEYSFQNNRYPADAAAGVMPAGMEGHLKSASWTSSTPMGGLWDWEPALSGYGCGILMNGVTVDDDRMAEIDERIDDGNLVSGLFRRVDTGKYIYIVEKE